MAKKAKPAQKAQSVPQRTAAETTRKERGPNVKETATVELSRCHRCQSTERAPYGSPTVTKCRTTVKGKPVTRVIRNRTRCLNCGTPRIDIRHEYHPEDERAAKAS